MSSAVTCVESGVEPLSCPDSLWIGACFGPSSAAARSGARPAFDAALRPFSGAPRGSWDRSAVFSVGGFSAADAPVDAVSVSPETDGFAGEQERRTVARPTRSPGAQPLRAEGPAQSPSASGTACCGVE